MTRKNSKTTAGPLAGGYIDADGRYVRPNAPTVRPSAPPSTSGTDAGPAPRVSRIWQSRTGQPRDKRVTAGWGMVLLGILLLLPGPLLHHSVEETPASAMERIYGGDLVQLEAGHEYALYSREDWGRRSCSVAPSSDLSRRDAGTDAGIRTLPVRDGDGLYTDGHAWQEFRVFAPTASETYAIDCDTDYRVILADPQQAPDAHRRTWTERINGLVADLWSLGLWLTLAGAVVLGWSEHESRARGVGRHLMVWSAAGAVAAVILLVVAEPQGSGSSAQGLVSPWLMERAGWLLVFDAVVLPVGLVCWIVGRIRDARRGRGTGGGTGPGGTALPSARPRATPGQAEDGTVWI